MKKKLIISLCFAACVALCAAVWPRNVEDEVKPADASAPAVSAAVEASQIELSPIILSADILALTTEDTEVSSEEKQLPLSEDPISTHNPITVTGQPSPNTAPGTEQEIDGKLHRWVPGFGWIEVGGPNTVISDTKIYENGNKVGCMGGDESPPSNSAQPSSDPAPGTEKYIDGTLHRWVPGFGWVPYGGPNEGGVLEDMYESGEKVGYMGADHPTKETTPPLAELPKSTEEGICFELTETPEKASTLPDYKPNTCPPSVG